MNRCALCRAKDDLVASDDIVTTVGGGYRCRDQHACTQRIHDLIDAHKALADACNDDVS